MYRMKGLPSCRVSVEGKTSGKRVAESYRSRKGHSINSPPAACVRQTQALNEISTAFS